LIDYLQVGLIMFGLGEWRFSMFKVKYLASILVLCSFCFLKADGGVSAESKWIYIFGHGLGADFNHVDAYKRYGVIPQSFECLSKNGPEVSNGGPTASCLAQDGDIDVIIGEIEAACEKYGRDCKIVLVGVSKSAATMLNTIGKLASIKSEHLKNIKAVILDSPFADANDVACDVVCPKRLAYSIVKSSLKIAVKMLINKVAYKNYDPYGIQPIKAVREEWGDVDKDMLIVFFHSKDDALINVSHSKLLSDEIRALGFKNTYFIQTSGDVHANIFWGNWSEFTLTRLWSIYKKYELPLPSEDEIIVHNSVKQALRDVKKMSIEEMNKFVENLRNGVATVAA